MADRKPNRADAVRQAVEDAFQTAAGQAQVSRGRAQDLVDELSGAAGRLRDVLDELRPPTGDDLAALRAEVRALAERVASLEAAAAPPPGQASARPPARGRGPGGPRSGSGKSGPRQAGGSAKRSSAGKSGSGGSGAKGAGRRRPPKG